MSEPFLSEIRMFGFGWPPRGWAQCDGQVLPINQNQSLYSLLGTTFGGDGRASFALPDMRGRTPVHSNGGSVRLGNKGGVESVTLTSAEMPSHSHTVTGTTENGNTQSAQSAVLAAGFDAREGKGAVNMYAPSANLVSLKPDSVSSNGSGQSHSNLQPSSVVNFCIALQGLFPSRN